MCSVRQSPMPWAPIRRARAASSGLSAFVRTFDAARRVGVAHDPVHGLDQLVAVLGGQPALEVLHDRGRHDGHPTEEHLAGARRRSRACRPRGSPSRRPVTGLVRDVDAESSAPQTAVLPMPRATTAACEVLPPRLVRMPAEATMPARSSGVGLAADEDGSRCPARPWPPRSPSRTRPHRPPRRGRRRCPWPAGCVDLGAEPREHQLRQLRAVDAAHRLVQVDERPRPPAAWRSGTPHRRCASRRGSAACRACRSRP